MRIYLILCAITAVVTAGTVPLVRRLALATNALTPVRQRDIHTVPTPRLGGMAMALGVTVGLAVASRVPFLEPIFADMNAPWGVLAAAVFVSLLGALDDWFDLSWPTKLAGQVLAAGFLAWQGVQLITLPVGGVTIVSSRLSLIVTILVVVATINAINFVDGLDGLAAGMVAIGGSAFFAYSYLLSRQADGPNYATLAALILALTVGACIGFLPHNFHPARIFMGDSGSMLLGLLFAAATISVTGQIDPGAAAVTQRQAFGAFLPVVLPFAVLALPLLDMLMAVTRRMRAGQSPFKADRMHLHHRLLRLGHTQRRAVAILYLWTAVLAFGTAGLAVFRAREVATGLAVAVAVALILTVAPCHLPGRRRARGPRHAIKEASDEPTGPPGPAGPPGPDGPAGPDGP
ncbi:MAG: undecaprenyl/decaprenyl-phosphate alpha-N-acetylglucosaminyl 1-phosphate transferase, partial [Bifidobacteriaceae bacterium]|nr:undecaprenyl/decaprenyl-phosphate alpha-N-acetylglucosaminyl 1-phosphate transferase [Bifidobacteriaceae bacterium]